MAEKKDIYIDGRIYVGLPDVANVHDYDSYPVTGPHNFTDGQDVTGLYRLDTEPDSDIENWVGHKTVAIQRHFPLANLLKQSPTPPVKDMEAEARELVAKFSSFETDFSYDGGYSFETLQRSDAEHCATIHLELMIEAFRKAGSDIMVRHYTQLIEQIKNL